jgi:ATP-dependent protease ClpP protease subunit
MKRLLIVAIIFFLNHQAYATTIEAVADPYHPTIIVIREHFDRDSSGSDIRLFELHAAEHKNAIVFLDSPGGSMQTGLRIGRIIRAHGFMTVVADYTQCASTCALAWLGGKQRFMGQGAQIGFHAARTSERDYTISLKGDTIIKAYLREIGFNDLGSVSFMTSTPPNSIRWMSQTDADAHGITVATMSVNDPWWAWTKSALGFPPFQRTDIGVLSHCVQRGLPPTKATR